jgi:translation initiation factor IF-3
MISPKPKNNFRNTARPRIKENVNEGIRVAECRVIFPDGTNEVLATKIAIQKAQALELDLILVSPTAKPPVAKVMDHGKWHYEEQKRQKEAKKKQHVILVKELKFRPNTDDHDYNFKRDHAVEFLKDGNKVKAIVQFRGREMAHTNLGVALLNRLVADLSEVGKAEASPRQDGKNAFVIFSAIKK